MSEEIIEQVFQAGTPARLDLDNIRGSVKILPQDAASEVRVIAIKAVKDLDSGDADLTTIEMSQREDDRVVVRTRFAGLDVSGFQKFKRKPCRINYTVQVPQDCEVKIETVSSAIELENLEGEFDLGSVSGDIELQNLAGDLNVQSVSGRIKGEKLDGELNGKNVSGNIHLIDSQIPALKVNTVSGEILIQSIGQTNTFRAHTVSGDMTLVLTEDQGITVHMRSLSGKLHMHHPDGITRQLAPKDLSVQGGGPGVDFETISGDLHLTPLELYQAQATSGAEGPDAHQHDVLESVARGELTAEQGLQALKGSGSGQ